MFINTYKYLLALYVLVSLLLRLSWPTIHCSWVYMSSRDYECEERRDPRYDIMALGSDHGMAFDGACVGSE